MEEQEEARKIQFTGKSSYIVSLPKSWVNEMGLLKKFMMENAECCSSKKTRREVWRCLL